MPTANLGNELLMFNQRNSLSGLRYICLNKTSWTKLETDPTYMDK